MSKMTKTVAALGVVAGLGVAMLPVGAFAAPADNGAIYGNPATQNVTFQAEVDDYIQITVAEAQVVAADAATTAKNAAGSTTFAIKSNNASGYTGTIAASTLDNGSASAVMLGNTATNKIPGGTAPVAGTSAWGYKIIVPTGVTGNTVNSMTGATTDAKTFADKTGATAAAGDSYTLDFEASVSASQAADTYTGQVTLTATAK